MTAGPPAGTATGVKRRAAERGRALTATPAAVRRLRPGVVAVLMTLLALTACSPNPARTPAGATAASQPPAGPTNSGPTNSGSTNAGSTTSGPAIAGPSPGTTQASPTPADQALIAAGDIASCDSSGDEATARLLDGMPGTVAMLGDSVYPDGSRSDFARCYATSWGRYKDRTRPAAGNHEYQTAGASGYFGYFGAAAGDPARGYYSYDLGAWHVVVVNSNCWAVGGCGTGSPQERWLRADLAASTKKCTLAYWHHPLFTSGNQHGPSTVMRPIFATLYNAGAEVVLSGHEHNYERFAPQDPRGRRDNARGIRAWVVGTGGASHYGFGNPAPNSEVRNTGTYGVLRLTLHAGGYDWQFVPQAGRSFTDRGSATCH